MGFFGSDPKMPSKVSSIESCWKMYCSKRWKNIKVVYIAGMKMFSVNSFLETSPNPAGVSSEENKTVASTIKTAEWDKAYTSNSGSENADS